MAPWVLLSQEDISQIASYKLKTTNSSISQAPASVMNPLRLSKSTVPENKRLKWKYITLNLINMGNV
jgi:hypothetical protein